MRAAALGAGDRTGEPGGFGVGPAGADCIVELGAFVARSVLSQEYGASTIASRGMAARAARPRCMARLSRSNQVVPMPCRSTGWVLAAMPCSTRLQNEARL
ncbi:hypothetical protein GCM10010381_06590 [Streptomyces xantholiticus]|nr:hypothetical protein GCM10010381_06590 [Streptomyces xantholiticus]